MADFAYEKGFYEEPRFGDGIDGVGAQELQERIPLDKFVSILSDVVGSTIDAIAAAHDVEPEAIVKAIYDYATERNDSFQDAFLAIASDMDPDIDTQVASEAIRVLAAESPVKEPPVLSDFETGEKDAYKDELYKRLEIVASGPNPATMCAAVLDVLRDKEDIEFYRAGRVIEHESFINSAELREDYKAVAQEDIAFSNDMGVLTERERALDTRIEELGNENAHEAGGKALDYDEIRMARQIAILDSGGYSKSATREGVMDEMRQYAKDHPDSPIGGLIEAREAYVEALAKVDYSSSDEDKRDLAAKYEAYNNRAFDITMVSTTPESADRVGLFADREERFAARDAAREAGVEVSDDETELGEIKLQGPPYESLGMTREEVFAENDVEFHADARDNPAGDSRTEYLEQQRGRGAEQVEDRVEPAKEIIPALEPSREGPLQFSYADREDYEEELAIRQEIERESDPIDEKSLYHSVDNAGSSMFDPGYTDEQYLIDTGVVKEEPYVPTYIDKELPGTDSTPERLLISPEKAEHSGPDKFGLVDDKESKVGIRADADAVVNYGVADRVYANRDRYPAFGTKVSDLRNGIYSAYDKIEAYAKDGAPLSTELKGIVDKLEELGDKNGVANHDAEIDKLTAQREDVFHRAGAIVAGTRDLEQFREDQAVFVHHRDEDYIRMNPDRPGIYDGREFADGPVRKFTMENSPDRDGIAARYSHLLDVRDFAHEKIPALRMKYEKARTPDQVEKADKELFHERATEQRAQCQMDRIYYRIEICNDGVKEYGIIDTTPDKVEKEPSEADVAKPMTQEEIAAKEQDQKLKAYEEAKADYEDIKDKYNFRNFFVSYDRLKMDIAAYNAGEKGSNGKEVSGGDIAMRWIEFSRSNFLDSLVEVALRKYFDDKFPGVTKDNEDPEDKVYTVNLDTRGQQAYNGHYDNGFIDFKDRTEDHRPQTANPEAGRFMGADLYEKTAKDDKGIDVRYTGPKSENAVTGGPNKSGEVDTVKFPSMRLVEMPETGSWYLVDPFGKTVDSNVMADSLEIDPEKVERPHFKTLDVSLSKSHGPRIEALAASKGISVDELKRTVSDNCKESFVSRGLERIEVHDKYIKETLIPDVAKQISAVSSEMKYLVGARDAFAALVEHPHAYHSNSEREGFEKYVDFAKDSIHKLATLREGLVTRFNALTDTVDRYSATREICRKSSGDTQLKTEAVVKAFEKSAGHIDTAYYGVTKSDITAIDKLCVTSGYDGKLLSDFYTNTDWPHEADILHAWNGAKVDIVEPKEEEIEGRLELSERLELMGYDIEKDFPGLIERGDKNVFSTSELTAHEVVASAGFLRTTNTDRIEAAGEARKHPRSENEELGRLGLERFQDWKPSERETYEGRIIRMTDLTAKQIPNEAQISRTRIALRDFSWGEYNNRNFGVRTVGPNIDWATVRPSEVLRDPNGSHFWVRPEKGDKHVPMTIQQTVAYMNGYLDKVDIKAALDKYFDISKNSASTFDFATDFLEINKFRIDPPELVAAFSEKLGDFVDDGKYGLSLSKHEIETVADCLVSAKDSIVKTFTDEVADKIEAAVSKAVDIPDNDRVSAFIEKVSETFEPVVDKARSANIDTESVKLSDDVASRLERLLENGVSEKDVGTIADIAKTLDAMFDGYSDMIKAVVRETGNDVDHGVDKGIEAARDDAAAVSEYDHYDAVDTGDDDPTAGGDTEPIDTAGIEPGEGSDVYRPDANETPGIDSEDGKEQYGVDKDEEEKDKDEDDRIDEDDELDPDSGLLDTLDEAHTSLEEMLDALEALREPEPDLPDVDLGYDVPDVDAKADGDGYVDSDDVEHVADNGADAYEHGAGDAAVDSGVDNHEYGAVSFEEGDDHNFRHDDLEAAAVSFVDAAENHADMDVDGVNDDVADLVGPDFTANFDPAALNYDDPMDGFGADFVDSDASDDYGEVADDGWDGGTNDDLTAARTEEIVDTGYVPDDVDQDYEPDEYDNSFEGVDPDTVINLGFFEPGEDFTDIGNDTSVPDVDDDYYDPVD